MIRKLFCLNADADRAINIDGLRIRHLSDIASIQNAEDFKLPYRFEITSHDEDIQAAWEKTQKELRNFSCAAPNAKFLVLDQCEDFLQVYFLWQGTAQLCVFQDRKLNVELKQLEEQAEHARHYPVICERDQRWVDKVRSHKFSTCLQEGSL